MHSDLIKFIRDIYKTSDFIPLHAPVFDQKDEDQVIDTLRQGYASSVGPVVEEFETEVKDFINIKNAVATVNGTSALHIALNLLGVRSNTEVLTQSFTFIATCNAIKYCGANPIFIDIDKSNLGMSDTVLSEFLEENCEVRDDGKCWNKISNKEIVACLPMHTYGFPLKIDNIKKICDKFKIILVEDAAESLGSFYKGEHVGRYGDCSILSFNGNKIITTGGGGIILTNDDKLAAQARHLSTTSKVPHPWLFDHDEIGYNYRLPSINAALGISQLKKIDEKLKFKRKLAQIYHEWGDKNGYNFVREPKNTNSNYWINLLLAKDLEERDAILEYTNNNLVMTRPAWTPMHKLNLFKDCQISDMTNTDWFYDRIINLPSSSIF